MDPSDVTFAILNYNGRGLLAGLLPTVAAQTARGFRITVIDDGSTDDSVAWLEREWPQGTVIRIPENIGVTRALNRAVQSACTPYVALLNNDLELEPRCTDARPWTTWGRSTRTSRPTTRTSTGACAPSCAGTAAAMSVRLTRHADAAHDVFCRIAV